MDSEKRLSALKDVQKNIEKQKLDLEKERKRLLNTRSSILCTSCQQPLADRFEMNREGLTNLGLRTAGDGGVYEKVSIDVIKILLYLIDFTFSYKPFQYLFALVKFCLIINIMIDFLLRIVQSSI